MEAVLTIVDAFALAKDVVTTVLVVGVASIPVVIAMRDFIIPAYRKAAAQQREPEQPKSSVLPAHRASPTSRAPT